MAYKTRIEEETTCLECGGAVTGRKDKHFCSPSCKNRYHNRLQRQRRDIRLETITALSRNYEILEALLKEKVSSMPLPDLVRIGFKPDYVTGHRKGLYRHEEFSCFDIRYYRSSTKIFNVRRTASGER
ncbi:MAG: DUF2116 family Zn-ribbon domain-containing protein [Bacteroidales bacterium]|nr:DUF2116 family Zn-ribbon domain-containing protein [Bacteroidales bacterium]